MSPEPHHQPPPKVFQALRVALLITWGVTFVAVRWWAFFLYVVPFLALITFFLLPSFPMILAALLLSGYLDGLPADHTPGTLKLLLVGVTWLAALIALSANVAARRRRVIAAQPEHESPGSDHEIPALSASSTMELAVKGSPVATRSANLRHDVRTPLNLILAFCEALLNPTSADRQPLPAPIREDIEAIYRNGQQLKPLVEKLLDSTVLLQADAQAPDPGRTRPRKTVILLDEGGAAFELFSQYIHQVNVVRVSSVEAIGRSRQDSDLLAVAISSDDLTLIPVIAQLVGNTVPILTFDLGNSLPQTPFYGASDYLVKPIEFEALMAALKRTGVLLRTVLIIDDNRDNVQMLSRMLNSVSNPPHLLKAYSGREALALLNAEIPDVILLDFVLPDIDGMTILDYLHMEGRLARIPVLLVSAHRPPDILPVPGVTKLTLFRLAGFSPARLAQHIEALLAAFGSQA